MEFKKPTVTKFKERCEQVYEFMCYRDYVTKPEIAKLLQMSYPRCDRQIRDIIATLAQTYPIVSTSDTNKGYKLAREVHDLELCKHSWAELSSRIDELNKRMKPLIKFLQKHKAAITLFD